MGTNLAIVHVNDIAFVASVLRDAQIRRGDVAELVDPPKPGAAFPWPWKLVAVAARLPLLMLTAMRLRRGRSDIIHIHYATQALIGPLAGHPFVIHCHGTDVRGVAPRSLRGRYLRFLFERSALVLVSTPDLVDHARRLRGDALFLPNPIDSVAFTPDGTPPQRDVLVGVRLDPIKGADTAILAIELLLARRPSTTVTIIANGPLTADARLRLDGRVRFVDPVGHADMPILLRDHRVVLGQFRLGILSQLELEAMACGAAVVTSLRYVGTYGVPPPIEEASDATAVAAITCDLLDDEDRRATLAVRGRQWVVAHHASDTVAARLDGLYRAILPGQR